MAEEEDLALVAPERECDIDWDSTDLTAVRRSSWFRVRFDRLTTTEKAYMRGMPDLSPGHRSGDIAERLGRKVTTVAPIRNALIEKGMLYSPAHGDTAFTAPLFDAFMRRIMPAQ